MKSTELIRKLPKEPEDPILYVVYDETHIEDAEFLIATIHGLEYLKEYVTVVTFKDPNESISSRISSYKVYIDPTVYLYKHSWND